MTLSNENLRGVPSDLYLDAMGRVSNRIFGILVEGYISAVGAYRNKSDGRGKRGDLSSSSSLIDLPVQKPVLKKPSTRPAVRPSTAFWDQAHMLAIQSQDRLSEAYAKFTARDLEAGKKKAVEGLNLLLQSVRQIHQKSYVDEDRETALEKWDARWTGSI